MPSWQPRGWHRGPRRDTGERRPGAGRCGSVERCRRAGVGREAGTPRTPGAAGRTTGRTLDPELRERVERLLDGLREPGAEPPRVDGIAARLGVTSPALAQLRQSGELVRWRRGSTIRAMCGKRFATQVDGLARRGRLSRRAPSRRAANLATPRGGDPRLPASGAATAQTGAPSRLSASSAGGSSSPATSRAWRKQAAAAGRSPRAS